MPTTHAHTLPEALPLAYQIKGHDASVTVVLYGPSARGQDQNSWSDNGSGLFEEINDLVDNR